jgi:hypothetical protein
VVYDPRRFEIAVTSFSAEMTAGNLEAEGWDPMASDGHRSLWARDRIAAARHALDRSNRCGTPIEPARGIEL